MEVLLAKFSELKLQQLHDIFELRAEVFVVEQNCPYQDVDGKDPESYHLLFYDHHLLIAYCRILPPGVSYPEPSIGRVVVKKSKRGHQLGELLMKQALSKTLELFNNQEIVISAQSYLLNFYQDLGFATEGNEYLEDDIPHQRMRYPKKK